MERVLIISSHFDDAEIGCGGTLIKHRIAGDEIIIAIMKSDEHLTGDQSLRLIEQKQSALILNANIKIFYGSDPIETKISELDLIKPDILYMPYELDTHQDHNRASQIGFAVSRHNSSTVLRYLTPTSHSYYPNYLSVIDMEQKKKLVSLFSSQMDRRPKFMEIMEAQNKYFGSLIPGDGHYAEGFCLFRKVQY